MTIAASSSRRPASAPQELAGAIDLAELMQILAIDDNTREQGRQLAAILDEHAEAIFSIFYDKIVTISWAHKFAEGEVVGLKRKQFAHWRALFAGPLDLQYLRHATLIGAVHRQRGIEPLLYIVGYGIVKTAILEIIAKKDMPPAHKGRLMVALDKFISLDVGLAMVGYSGHEGFAQLFAPGFSG